MDGRGMKSRKEGSPQVRPTTAPILYAGSPQVGVGPFSFPHRLPAAKREKGVNWRRGCSSAPTPSPRLGVAAALAAPRVAHPWEGAPGPPVFNGRRIPGLSLSPRQAGGGCGSTHQFRFVFRFLFVGGPVPRAPLVASAPTGFLAAASRARRRRRPGLLHLSSALSPVPWNPTSPSLRKPLGAVSLPRVDSAAPLPGRESGSADFTSPGLPAPRHPSLDKPLPLLCAGASPAPERLQLPQSPPPSGRCLGWRESRCLSL